MFLLVSFRHFTDYIFNKNNLWSGCRLAEVFKGPDHFGMLDDKMNGRGIVLGHDHPFPRVDLDLNIPEGLHRVRAQVISGVLCRELMGRRKVPQIVRIGIAQALFLEHTGER